MCSELADDVRDQRCYQRLQVSIADVAGRDQQQLGWSALEEMRIDEIRILGDDDPLFLIRELNDLIVGRPIPIG